MKYLITVKGYGKNLPIKEGETILEIDPQRSLAAQLLNVPNGDPDIYLPQNWTTDQQERTASQIQEALGIIFTNRNTLKKFEDKWEENAFWNHDRVTTSTPIHLLKPQSPRALICGNGPSLDADGFDGIIFAPWHCAPRLKKVHYLGHVDADPILEPTPLQPELGIIATPSAARNFFTTYPDAPVYSYLSRDLTPSIRFAQKLNCIDHDPINGTVVDMLIRAALYAGYPEIWLSGVDLCFYTYSDAVGYDPIHQKHFPSVKEISAVDNHQGKKVYIHENFKLYQKGLEAHPQSHPSTKFYNASNGLKISGYEFRTLPKVTATQVGG